MQPQYFKPFSWLLMKYYPERCSAARAARLFSNIKYWWLQNMNFINWFCALLGLNFVTEFTRIWQENCQKISLSIWFVICKFVILNEDCFFVSDGSIIFFLQLLRDAQN